MGDRQLLVDSVSPGSIAAELGVEPGDIILQINERAAADIIDYRFFSAGENINILIQKTDGDCWLLDVEKDWDEDLGITFVDGGLGATTRCRNKCIFCFVDQMPPRMRPSLYVKDDDYRLSFFQGNFITLSNLGHRDMERIIEMHLSPLYISVHTTNPELRSMMMRNPGAGKIMQQLARLAAGGIEMHTQAVLCPGVNDGQELKRTVADLAGLWPAVRSLALVPVGLTRYRDSLYPIRGFEKHEAREIVEQVENWQEQYIKRFDYPLVFASDEFYLLAGKKIPSASRYGGFPQTENGVGLIRLFWDDWERLQPELPGQISTSRHIILVTGKSAAPVLAPVVHRLNKINKLSVKLLEVENKFFGPAVTVAGLLTGTDIADQIKTSEKTDAVIVPGVSLRQDKPVFLDGFSVDDLFHRLGVPVIPAHTPEELVKAATGVSLG